MDAIICPAEPYEPDPRTPRADAQAEGIDMDDLEFFPPMMIDLDDLHAFRPVPVSLN